MLVMLLSEIFSLMANGELETVFDRETGKYYRVTATEIDKEEYEKIKQEYNKRKNSQ